MPITRITLPGSWCDVDYSPDDDCFVLATLDVPHILNVEWRRDRQLVGRARRDQGRYGLYLRAAVDDGGWVATIQQDGRDRNPETGRYYPAIIQIVDRAFRVVEVPFTFSAFGQQGVEVVGLMSGWTIYVLLEPIGGSYYTAHLTRDGRLENEQVHSLPEPMTTTSQGFGDGETFSTLFRDLTRATVPGMVYPSTDAELSVGQAGEKDEPWNPLRCRGTFGGVFFTVIEGLAYEPHLIARERHGVPVQWVACCRTPTGAQFAFLEGPFDQERFPPQPGPAPTDPPVPGPTPTDPHPEPEEPMERLTAAHKELRARYVARFPVPSKNDGEGQDAWEDRVRRQWTIPFIQQMMASFPGDGFCVKSADAGRPESKDAMGRERGGRLYVYDLLEGTGTGRPRLVDDPAPEDITGQFVHREYGPVDRLGGGTVPAPDPDPGQPPQQPPSGEVDWAAWSRDVLVELRAIRQACQTIAAD